MSGEGRERDVHRVSRPGEAERFLETAFDAGSGAVGGEVDGSEVDLRRFEVVFGVGPLVFGPGCLNFAGSVGESGGEVGFPGEFGGVAEEPPGLDVTPRR